MFVSYAAKNNKLYIRFFLSRKITKAVRSTIYLLPYSLKKDFADMPKLRLIVKRTGLMFYDRNARVFINQAKMRIENNDSIIIELPMAALGSPDYIISRANVYTNTAPSDMSAWRILELGQ